MSSDSEIDGIERFQNARQDELYAKAGLDRARHEDLEMSDEEVMGIDSGGEESEDEGQDQYYEQAAGEENDEENWGDTRDNYFGGEDDLGAEEGASEEEEEEALRLQQKQLAEMEDADFVDEDDLEGWKTQATTEDLGVVKEPQTLDASSMSAEERRELIETRFPVILLLANELKKCGTWEHELSNDASLDEHLRSVGRATLQTYKGMIYSFFALFSERVNQGNTRGLTELEEHPVHEGILTARQLWEDFQRTKTAHASAHSFHSKASADQVSDVESLSEGDNDQRHTLVDSDHNSRASQTSDEAASDMNDSQHSVSESEPEFESELSKTPSSTHEDDEFSIAKPTAKRSRPQQPWKVVGDYDETADTIEQQQRAKSKQSLRFYTSQIGKSEAAKNSDNIGDMDVPYREREFERRQRLMQAAQKRGQEPRDRLGDDGDDDEDTPFDMDASNNDEPHGNASSEHPASAYAQMKQQRDSKKDKRRKEYSDAKEAARAGRFAEYLAENPNADKRAINYQIEKNKGLTPRRKKENRNARVKKRMRYEAAQKKLKGVRKVYEEPQGPYQGELTGIRKNLVHSNKFKN